MVYYNTKFGDPASISIKYILWTMFCVKNIGNKMAASPPFFRQLKNKFDVHNLPAIFQQCA